MIEKIVPGQIVRSKAGHDKLQYFVIIEVVDNNFVLIVDGNRRTLEKPKKKKIIHLNFLNQNAFNDEEFRLTNKNLRKLTQRYNEGDKI
ncbi:MAG: KOW domain-containing RNA-binding protein [Ezakiella sp.]|nr:KOW domain-containing RNA-binding protein [Ezakiella sp.]MDD7472370.1 KOW domain-containing RNA-binding protein [Bacillota bacterium]MDY3923104.1 KOW domain-containing RNA-binding protein [Ezakiella sp.]